MAWLADSSKAEAAAGWVKELPYWQVYKESIVTVDGYLFRGAELEGLDPHCLQDGQLDAVAEQLSRWICSMDEGVAVQFQFEVDNDYLGAGWLPKYQDVTDDKALGSSLLRSKIEHLTVQQNLFHTRLFLFVGMPIQENEKVLGLLGKQRQWIGSGAQEKCLARLNRLMSVTVEELTAIGVKTCLLDAQKVSEVIYRYLNPKRMKIVEVPKVTVGEGGALEAGKITLRSQLCFSELEVENDRLSLDGRLVRVLSMKTLPDVTMSTGILPLLQGLKPNGSCSFRIVVAFNVLSQRHEISKLKMKGNVRQMLASLSRRASNIDNQVASDELEDCLRHVFETGQKIVGLSVQVILSADDVDELDDLTNQALILFRKVNDMEGMVEQYSQLAVFATSLPGNQHRSFRTVRVTSENVADLLPVYQPWSGCEKAITILKNHLNGLVRYDPFDESLQAYNSILCGSTGSGKSFTAIYLLLSCVMRNYPTLIIDLGGSYRKLCSVLGGQYIEIEKGISLNPFFCFDEMRDKTAPQVETKFQFLLSLMERLVIEKGKSEKGLLNIEKAVLQEGLRALYSQDRKEDRPTISDLVAVLKRLKGQSGDRERMLGAERVVRQLELWCEGMMGQWLNQRQSLSLISPFVVLDMKGIDGDLKEIILLILVGHTWSKIMSHPGPKMVVLDEVWSLLGEPATAAFVGELYRTARKYHCGIMSISQSPNDFVQSLVGPAVVSNSIVRYILRLKDGWECLADALKMNPREISLVQNLKFKKGEYSEIFLSFGDKRSVIRVEPSPLEYWLCTNHPSDLETERRFQAKYKNLNTFDVLRLLSRLYPKGSWVQQETTKGVAHA